MGNPRPFPVYPEQVAGDLWCNDADNRTFGAYWRLLFFLWTNGHLNNDLRSLSRIAKEDVRTFRRMWFGCRPVRDDDGHVACELQPAGIGSRFVGVRSGVVGGEPGEELTNLKAERSAVAQAKMLRRSALDRAQLGQKSVSKRPRFLGAVPPACSKNLTLPTEENYGRGAGGRGKDMKNEQGIDPRALANLEALRRGEKVPYPGPAREPEPPPVEEERPEMPAAAREALRRLAGEP